jgi:hypothetical protein
VYWLPRSAHDHVIGEFAAHSHGHRQRGLGEIGAHVVMGTAPRIKRGDRQPRQHPDADGAVSAGFGCGGLTVPSPADPICDVLECSAVQTCISAASGDCALAA